MRRVPICSRWSSCETRAFWRFREEQKKNSKKISPTTALGLSRGGVVKRGQRAQRCESETSYALTQTHAHVHTHAREHCQWTSEITFYRKQRRLLKINTIRLPYGVPTSAVACRRHRGRRRHRRTSSRPLPPRTRPSTGIPTPPT